MNRRTMMTGLLACALPGPAIGGVKAFPARPIRVIVPFAAGGPMDTVVRALAQALTNKFGQPVVIESRTGAGSIIGVDAAAKSPPDGYTLVCVANSFAINQTLISKLPYNSFKDLRPVGLLTRNANILVANPRLPAQNLGDLIVHAKANPGKLSYATGGNGTIQHLIGEMLRAEAGINIVHVPYKGQAPATSDLLGGQIDLIIANLPEILPHVSSGKLRSLGVTTSARAAIAPDLVTIAEQGFPDFDTSTWFGLLAPAGVPDEIVAHLNAALVEALTSADIHDSFVARGLEPTPSTPDEFGALIRSEIIKYAKVIERVGMKAD
jgi:tripartite-type tricarboxylate transporter receptor subunit TctC